VFYDIRVNGTGGARRDHKLSPLNSDFDLYSVGRDQQTAASLADSRSRDDIVRARDGGFIGTAEEFDP
jgi:general secretion pathway protein G